MSIGNRIKGDTGTHVRSINGTLYKFIHSAEFIVVLRYGGTNVGSWSLVHSFEAS